SPAPTALDVARSRPVLCLAETANTEVTSKVGAVMRLALSAALTFAFAATAFAQRGGHGGGFGRGGGGFMHGGGGITRSGGFTGAPMRGGMFRGGGFRGPI